MPIDPLPSLSRSSPTFRSEVDEFFQTSLPAFSVSVEAARVAIVAAEISTGEDADAAATSQAAAAASEAVAAAAALTALNAPGTSATSTTSHDISVGAKTYTVQTGKLFVPGQRLTIARTSSPANVNYAYVNTYNSGTGALAVTVDGVAGSGTGVTDWTVAISGTPATGSGVGSVSYTGLSATKALVAADAGTVYLTSTVPITVTMPAANTLGSTKLFILKNAGLFDMQINDGAGNPLFLLRARTTKIMWAVSTGTIAGTWTALDGETGFSGTETTLNSVSGSSDISSCVIGAGKYVVGYTNASNYACVRVVTVGSTISPPGAEYVANAIAVDRVLVVRMDNDKIAVVYVNATDIRAKVLTFSGTAVSGAGGEVTVNPTGNTFNVAACQAATNKVLVMFRDSGDSNYGNARVLNSPATTITQGTEFRVNAANTTTLGVCQLDTDKVLAVYCDTVAGETQSKVLSITATTTIGGGAEAVLKTGTNFTYVSRLDTNKAYVGHGNEDQIVTAPSTSVVPGALFVPTEAYSSSAAFPLSSTQVLTLGAFNNGSAYLPSASVVDISGTPTFSPSFRMSSLAYAGGPSQGQALSANSGVAFYTAFGTGHPTAAIIYKGALV